MLCPHVIPRYLQNRAMPVSCLLLRKVDYEYNIIITYKTGKTLHNVERHQRQSGIMQFASVPVEGLPAMLHEWLELRWVRIFNRHLQRSLGLGD